MVVGKKGQDPESSRSGISDSEDPNPRGAAAESGLRWSLHEGLAGGSAETGSETVSQRSS